MKQLVIIDFSHLSSRMLHTAVASVKPKKVNGKFVTEQYIKYYKHLVFNSLQYIKNKFKGEIIIATDSSNNWRKEVYPEYKGHRSKLRAVSEINFEEYYKEVNKISEEIAKCFPFKVIAVDRAEADDIAGVLANKFGVTNDVILVTSDLDWCQVSAEHYSVKMFDPIKKTFVIPSDNEKRFIKTPVGDMTVFSCIHTLMGDKGDNVQTVTYCTEFSDVFKSHLKTKGIKDISVKEFNSLSIKDEIIGSFDVYKITKSGKNKGIASDELDIFKTVPLGEKNAEKITLTEDSLNEFLNKNSLYLERFILNNTLVDFDRIPEDIQNEILFQYNNVKVHFDPQGMLKFFIDEGLDQMVNSINKFYDTSYAFKSSTSLDDFL